MLSRIRQAWSTSVAVVGATYADYRANRTIRLGAGLSYYGLFAVVPLLTLAMGLAAVIFDDDDVQDYLVEVLDGFLGEDEELAQTIMDEIDLLTSSSSFGVIGLVTLLIASSLVFVALQDAFNEIWGIPVRPGMIRFFTRRLTAFLVVLVVCGVLIAGLVVQALTGLLDHLLPGRTEAASTLTAAIGSLGTIGALVVALMLLYKMLGPEELRWRPVLVAAPLATVAMSIGTVLLAEYLTRWGARSVPGAAAGIALVLLWIYYQAQILLAGAHLARVLDEGRHRPDGGTGA